MWASLRRAPLACAVFGLWIAGVAWAYALSASSGSELTTCKLRAVTGLPCPTCGGTRATFALVGGDVRAALAFNPWVVALHLVVLISIAAAVLKRPRWNVLAQLSARPKVALPLLLISLAANWWYVIRTQG